jgi:leucyl-tRNA synthetase
MDREFMPPKEFARMWRNQPTPAEAALWEELKDSKIGFKFSRQIKRGGAYVDFCCRQYKLAVEVDGEAHDGKAAEDEDRTRDLRERGYEVVRFANEDVMDRPAEVVAAILKALESRPRFRY